MPFGSNRSVFSELSCCLDDTNVAACACVCGWVNKSDELYQSEVDADSQDAERDLWIAYCRFHLADYTTALHVSDCPSEWICIARICVIVKNP